MLFACLQSHSVAELAVFVFGPSDDASRHIPLVLVTCGEVACRRPAVKHRCTQSLCCTEYDIRSPFSRRSQQGKTQNIGGNGNFAVCFMCLLCEVGIVFHITAGVRILQDAGEDFRWGFKLFVFAYPQFDALWNGTCGHYCQGLREDVFVHKDYVGTCFLLGTRTQSIHHGYGFGGGSRFIQQWAVGERHSGEVTDGSLEIHQRFQSSLRHFCLIRRVRSIPYGIFEYIPLDNGRSNRIIPPQSDVCRIQFVFTCQVGNVFSKFVFRQRLGQCQRFLQSDVGRDGFVDQFIQWVYAYFAEHHSCVFFIDADVTAS